MNCLQVEKTVASLAAAEDFENSLGLYRLHIRQLIEWVANTQHEWTKYSVQHLQFETIITQSGKEDKFHALFIFKII